MLDKCNCELYLYNESPFKDKSADNKKYKGVLLTYSPNYVDIKTKIIMSGMPEVFESHCGKCQNMPLCFGYYLTMVPSNDWKLNCEYIEGDHGIELSYKQAYFNTAGQFLDKYFLENNIDRTQFYITSIVKCATPADRAPTIKEINACNPRLVAELRAIDYEFIICLGQLTTFALFGKIIEIPAKPMSYNNAPVYVTYNPADIIKLNMARIQAKHHNSNKFNEYTNLVKSRSAHVKKAIANAISYKV